MLYAVSQMRFAALFQDQACLCVWGEGSSHKLSLHHIPAPLQGLGLVADPAFGVTHSHELLVMRQERRASAFAQQLAHVGSAPI